MLCNALDMGAPDAACQYSSPNEPAQAVGGQCKGQTPSHAPNARPRARGACCARAVTSRRPAAGDDDRDCHIAAVAGHFIQIRALSGGRGRIDQLFDFGDFGRGKAADSRMLVDDGLVLGEIDAEGLVVGHKALDPLNIRPELLQGLFDFAAAARSCSRSKVPTFGMSRSMMNRRSAIVASMTQVTLKYTSLKYASQRALCRSRHRSAQSHGTRSHDAHAERQINRWCR
jgi:hypothetical protein